MDTNIRITTNGKKRILIFSLVYYPRFIGGAEVAVKEITDRLGDDFEFDMITFRDGMSSHEKIGNCALYRVVPNFVPISVAKYLFPFFACAKALSLHGKNHYDATWSLMANYAGFAALFFKLLRPRVPFILNLQEGDPTDYIKRRVGILYPVFKMIFTKADSVTALSVFLANWAKEMGATAPITVVPNGVDIRRFQVSASSFQGRKETRESFDFTEQDTIMVTTSRLVEKNAVGDVIEALQYLPESVKFLVIGVGALESGLRLKAESLKLEARVHFAGFIPHEKMPPYLWASDIFIRPSLSEGQGASFMEAMAAGLPVIATPVGGIPDFLKDGETGLFCEVGNPKSIAQKVEKLMKDLESRDYIIRTAGKMVAEKYDWDLIAQRMGEVLKTVKLYEN